MHTQRRISEPARRPTRLRSRNGSREPLWSDGSACIRAATGIFSGWVRKSTRIARGFPRWARLGSNQRPLACEARSVPHLELYDLQGFLAVFRSTLGPRWWIDLQGLFGTLGHGNAPWPRPAAPVRHARRKRKGCALESAQGRALAASWRMRVAERKQARASANSWMRSLRSARCGRLARTGLLPGVLQTRQAARVGRVAGTHDADDRGRCAGRCWGGGGWMTVAIRAWAKRCGATA